MTLLAGCFTTEDTFGTDVMRAGCAAAHNCAKAAFLEDYDDVADCVSENQDVIDEQKEAVEDCTYDPQQADECLRQTQISGATCNKGDGVAIEDACAEVYDCGE